MNSTVQCQLIDIYTTVIIKYLDAIKCITFMPSETDYDCILYTGINIIQRIFEYTLITRMNLENAHHYSQKSYVYFIEYMEQIYINGLSHHFSRNDVILFIYKKTILDMNNINNDGSNVTTTMSNILSLNDTNEDFISDECVKLVRDICTFTNRLLCWENTNITTDERICICQQYLPPCKDFIKHIELSSIYLDYIHDKTYIQYTIYCELLTEINTLLKTPALITRVDENINNTLLVKFYLEEDMFYQKIKGNNMKEFARWLYTPVII